MSTKVGDLAPDFTLTDQNNNEFTLKDLIGKQNIVLFFYPRDKSHGCTKEACAFRDNFEMFRNQNTTIIGISNDSIERHQSFASHLNLPFQLLSDENNAVRKLYGVKAALLGLIPGRKTYIINKQGIIAAIFDYQFNPKRHVTDSLKAIEKL